MMGTNGYSVYEAATIMGVSEKTIRRRIKSGKIKAFIDPGKYGDTYRIPELPPEYGDKTVAIPKKKTVKAATNNEVVAKLNEVLSRLDKLENVQPPAPAPVKAKPKRQVKDRGERLEYAEQLIKDDPERKLSHADIQAKIKAKYGHGVRIAELIAMRVGQAQEGGK